MNKVRSNVILAIATVGVVGLMSIQAFATPVRPSAPEMPVIAVAGQFLPGDVLLGEPAIVALSGEGLRLYNADPFGAHSITSIAHHNGVPLFDTGVVAPGANASAEGVQELAPGDYPFRSTFSGNMTGTLRVLDPEDDVRDAIATVRGQI